MDRGETRLRPSFQTMRPPQGGSDMQPLPVLGGSALDMPRQLSLAKRLLEYAQEGSTALAPAVLEVPVERYLDPQLWNREVETLFKRLPIVAGLSCELPKPGAYIAQTIVGAPLLLTRDDQGRVNAFLNVCTHRGAKVVAEH